MIKGLRTALVHIWFRLTRAMTLGARVVAIDTQQRVCLVRHTYTSGWHLPGGGVERSETGLDAAIKEAREEAGLLIAPDHIKLVSIHANFANFPGDHVLVYHAALWEMTTTDTAHEIAEHGFFPLDQLPEGVTQGTMNRLREALGAPVSPHW